MLNVAVVGLGFMGVTHLKSYLQVPGVRIAALCGGRRPPPAAPERTRWSHVGFPRRPDAAPPFAPVADGVHVQAHVFLMRRAEEMDDDAEADRAALQLEAAEVGEQVEALFVAQCADDGEEVAAGDAVGRHVLAGEVLRGRETGGERGGVHVRA